MSSNPYGYPSTSSANQFSSNPYAVVQSNAQPRAANLHEYDVGMLEQASAYVPGAAVVQRGGRSGKIGKKTTVIRKGGGKTWEDTTLLEWDPRKPLLLHILLMLILCRMVQVVRR